MIENFQVERTTIWSFPKRGTWSRHSSGFRGNWAPQIPRNLILLYSEPGDVVLDPFLGSGTTLVETKLLGRQGVGVDINEAFLKSAKEQIAYSQGESQSIHQGDVRDLHFLRNDSIDLALLHPPYASAIKYSNMTNDLSQIDTIDLFCCEFAKAIDEVKRVTKPNSTIALMIGDLRKKRKVVPLGFQTLKTCLDSGIILKEIIIKIQHNCASMGKWEIIAQKMGFLLLKHEYLFVFENC